MNLLPRIVRNPVRAGSKLYFSTTTCHRGTFEPDYLDSSGPVIPTYPPLNIQIKGYNFDVLESLQSYIHNLAENMGIDVDNAWATPAKTYQLTTYVEGGTRPKDTYNLSLYERNVKVVGLRSVDAPILIDTIRTALPEGVIFNVHEHTRDMEEERWIADPFIDSLRTELDAAADEKEKEQIKRDATMEAKAARKKAELLKSLTD